MTKRAGSRCVDRMTALPALLVVGVILVLANPLGTLPVRSHLRLPELRASPSTATLQVGGPLPEPVPLPASSTPSSGMAGSPAAGPESLLASRHQVGPLSSVNVQLSASPRRGPIPLSTTFTATVRGSGGVSAFNLSWNLGDGSAFIHQNLMIIPGSSGVAAVNHTYNQVGAFLANLTVSDGVDANSSALLSITVTLPLAASATATPLTVTSGRPVVMRGNATGGSPPYTFIWSGVPSGCAVTGQNLTCVPKQVGNYSVRLQVSDAIPDYASTYVHFSVNPKLAASATYTSWYRCVGSIDLLTDNFTGVAKGGTGPYVYWWNLGDGSPNLTGTNISHNYTQATVLNVTLSITDTSGAVANRTIAISTSFVSCGGVPPFTSEVTVALIGGVIAGVAAVGVLSWVLWRSRTPRPPPPTHTPPDPSPSASLPPGAGR